MTMTVTETIRWGILGPGSIARKFATGLQSVTDAKLVAVGSRSLDSANSFADQFGAERRYGSYAELVADPEVDAIYVATPHSFHREHTELCLRAGKAVLCEKPFAINRTQSEAMIQVAREQGVFLMEAMWTRFLPLIVRVRELIAEGAIGELRMLWSDFGFRTSVNPSSRLFDPALGGGGLLDVGIYPVSMAHLLLGKPNRIASMADLGSTGIDEQAGMILGFPGEKMAILATAVRTTTPMETTIMGSEGSIRIHTPSWCPTQFTLTSKGKAELFDVPFEGNGYNYEAIEVGRCLRAGLKESPGMTHADTLEIMGILDDIRTQWGMKYPME
jgi:predicted dehydrogenase